MLTTLPAPCTVITVNIVKKNVITLNSCGPDERYANAEPSIVGTKLADSDHGRTANRYVLIFIKTADGCSLRAAIADDDDDTDEDDVVDDDAVDDVDETSPLFILALFETDAPLSNRGDLRPSPIC